jgi:hypothetical protein
LIGELNERLFLNCFQKLQDQNRVALAQAEFNRFQKIAVGELRGDSLTNCMTKTAYLQLIVLAFIIYYLNMLPHFWFGQSIGFEEVR